MSRRIGEFRLLGMVAWAVLAIGGCGQGSLEPSGSPPREISVGAGRLFEVTLQTIGPGMYASPPAVSRGLVQFVDMRLVAPYVPAGPTQRFRFTAIRVGDAVIEFRNTESGKTLTYVVHVK